MYFEPASHKKYTHPFSFSMSDSVRVIAVWFIFSFVVQLPLSGVFVIVYSDAVTKPVLF